MAIIENFLKTFSSKKTIKTYRWCLNQFFKTIFKDFKEEDIENFAEKYLKEKRNYEEDIENFFSLIKEEPPKSIKLMLSVIRTFLIENGIEIKEQFWRRIRRRIKGARARTIDYVPSNEELKQILLHTHILGKALFTLLTSSGMRIGEALKLKISDIDLDKDPGRINIRAENSKSGNPRIAFISKEAASLLKEWLKIRNDYLKAAIKKSHTYPKKLEDDRLFPFDDNTAYKIWRNALRKSGFLKRDISTNRHVIHPHVLRKFFRTKMATLIPVDVVEALMGHEGYLTEVYRKYSLDDLAAFYKKGESAITIFSNIEEVSKLRSEIEERNKQLQNVINSLVVENMNLKNQISMITEQLKEIYNQLNKIQEKLKK